MKDWPIKLYSWKENAEVSLHWGSYPRGFECPDNLESWQSS